MGGKLFCVVPGVGGVHLFSVNSGPIVRTVQVSGGPPFSDKVLLFVRLRVAISSCWF